MKNIFTTICLFFCFFMLNAQTVVLQRTSELMPQIYQIEGQAFLEELSDGSLVLRLSEDFDTPPGPDVRILLGNSLSQSGAEEIINLSTIGHFNGANSFEVPANIAIDDFDRILFFCVNFQQFWASGSFGDVVDPNGGAPECEESTVSISDGTTEIDICPTDEVDDPITFSNSLEALGANYAYLITDENNILQEVVTGESFDFSGSTTATQRVHGVHFDGMLTPAIGDDRLATTASGCSVHSDDNDFVTINKTGACISTFQCEESLTATTNWAISTDICPTDDADDVVELRNNLFIPPGEHYAYLITDANEVLQEVVLDSIYDFSGSSEAEQRVYGMHYDGTINAAIGQNRLQTTASECFIHSGANLFLTINKTGACENTTSTNDTFLKNAVDIFPNPSDGTFNINYNNVSVDKVLLFDGSGKLVQTYSDIDRLELDNAGLYFIRFITADSSATKRIFVR